MVEREMDMLITIMVVNEINEKGVVFKYKNRTYFLDKYDTHKRILAVGDYVPTIIIIEKYKYGFVITAKSIVDIGKELLALPKPTVSTVTSVIVTHSGYYHTLNNLLKRNVNKLYFSNGNIGTMYNGFLSSLIRDEHRESMYTYTDAYHILQLIQVISIEYSEIFSITDLT